LTKAIFSERKETVRVVKKAKTVAGLVGPKLMHDIKKVRHGNLGPPQIKRRWHGHFQMKKMEGTDFSGLMKNW
jgi:hypothetical protein